MRVLVPARARSSESQFVHERESARVYPIFFRPTHTETHSMVWIIRSVSNRIEVVHSFGCTVRDYLKCAKSSRFLPLHYIYRNISKSTSIVQVHQQKCAAEFELYIQQKTIFFIFNWVDGGFNNARLQYVTHTAHDALFIFYHILLAYVWRLQQQAQKIQSIQCGNKQLEWSEIQLWHRKQ